MQDKAMIEASALQWIIRQRDPDFEDWDGFTAWLEHDARHAEVYQAMAVADADMAPLVEHAVPAPIPVPVPAPANDDARPQPGWHRRSWIGGALAASLVAAIGLGVLYPRSDPWQVETAPGERRTVALADGSQIMLNGGTRIVLDRKAPRRAVLETGEAMFVVHHDEKAPFEVKVGEARLVDIGTAFNVLREGDVLDVAVSEGAVLYNPQGEAARIDAGRRLHVVEGTGNFTLSQVDGSAVAGWREGRLVYNGQPLSAVAADLARFYGVPVSVPPAISARPFRGVLILPPVGDAATLGPLLDVEIRRDGKGWTFAPRS